MIKVQTEKNYVTFVQKENMKIIVGFLNRIGLASLFTLKSNGNVIYTGDSPITEQTKENIVHTLYGYERALHEIREGYVKISDIESV